VIPVVSSAEPVTWKASRARAWSAPSMPRQVRECAEVKDATYLFAEWS
jgi:hypothetical protein